MTITFTVEEDGLALRNISVPGEEKSKFEGTTLRADCDDFRKFLTEAKAGKYDDLV
jgi:hypothetical protein